MASVAAIICDKSGSLVFPKGRGYTNDHRIRIVKSIEISGR